MCYMMQEVLSKFTENYKAIELDDRDDCDAIQNYLNEITGARSVCARKICMMLCYTRVARGYVVANSQKWPTSDVHLRPAACKYCCMLREGPRYT